MEDIALVLSPRLGDSLYLMTVAHNLHLAGRAVTVFGVHAYALLAWFPGFDIRPLPDEKDVRRILGRYQTIVQMHEREPITDLEAVGVPALFIKRWALEHKSSLPKPERNGFLRDLQAFSRAVFGIEQWTHDNGLRPPPSLHPRKHIQHVIIHPTSSEPARCWPPDRYVKLALRLRRSGYHPLFVLAKHERAEWAAHLEPHGLATVHATDLNGVAAAMFESGWFVGADSGIGHLASACGLPTVTITDRPRNMNRWKPAWAPGLVVSPWWLPLPTLRRKYWRRATTVGRVLHAFQKLRSNVKRP